jgi:hypothetical protein
MRRCAPLLLGLCLLPLPAAAGTGLDPDLTVTADHIELDLDTSVAPGDVAEACARATTGVDLLRFSATTANHIDAGDLVIGDPMCPDCDLHPDEPCGNPDFHCSPADGHGHAHFTEYARYELLDGAMQVVRTGGKFGFCLEDTSCEGDIEPFFDCDNQGLTAGCEDLYSTFLGCQYIDVTGLADGEYTLRVTADPNGRIDELDESNNSSTYTVPIAGAGEPDDALPGTSLEVKIKKGAPVVQLVAKADTPFVVPSPPVAPTLDGATLSIEDTGTASGPQVLSLPAEGWKGLGKPAGSKGYRYKGGDGDDCSKAKITAKRVSATCSGAAVALPAVGPIELVLVGGSAKRFCATFGGTQKRNDAEKLKRVKAPAAPCPEPPAP